MAKACAAWRLAGKSFPLQILVRGLSARGSGGLTAVPPAPASTEGKGAIVESTDCVVIGAGVIGLAVARAPALAGQHGHYTRLRSR